MTGSQQRDGEQRAGNRHRQRPAQQFVGILNLRDVVLAARVKGRRRNDKDGGVDEEREHERHGRIDRGKLDRLRFPRGVLLVFARLHDRRVQVKVMRHDCRAQNADGDIQHLRVLDDFKPGHKPAQDFREVGFGKNDFSHETAADGEDQGDDQRLDVTKAFVLKIHDREHIQRGNAHAPHQRDLEQQVEGDG